MVLYDNTGVTVTLDEIVRSGYDIWNFNYPIPATVIEYNGKTAAVPFDKERLETLIIDHYRFRQIGQETVARWHHYLKTRMNEIMPYYAQLYEFEAKWRNIDDPLESYNLVETFRQDITGNGTVNGSHNNTAENTSKFSDTPQGTIDNIERYLTNATKINGTDGGTSNTTTTDKGHTEHELIRRGNIGVQPLGGEVLNIRQAMINIDMMVVNELKDLFLQVY